MKNMVKLFGLIALALVMGFSFAGCGGDPGGPPGGPGGSGETVVLLGTWVHQQTSPNSFVVLEFTQNQLITITNGTAVTTYYTENEGEIKTGASSGSLDEVFCDSYEIESGTLTLEGGESDTLYPSMVFYKVNAFAAEQWKDGVITSGSKGQVWYSFNVAEETAYSVWWNDGLETNSTATNGGNGVKTLDIYASAYYKDGSAAFASADTAWATATSFTPDADGTVYVKVTPSTLNGTGTFGIVYSTGTDRPTLSFNPPSPIPLSANQWKDGEITAASNGAVWYSFPTPSGTPSMSNIWWNEGGDNGNGMKTLNVKVRGFFSDGSSAFTTNETAWGTPEILVTTKTGTVYLKVMPSTSGNTGTFGIVYNSGISGTRPPAAFNPPTTPLTADVWKDGEITAASNGTAWYSLTVTSGTPYYFWWNETASSSNGNRTKTLDISVRAYANDGSTIPSFASTDTAWATAKTFTPTTGGTVYIRVTPSSNGATGTFGIVYSTTDERPPVQIDVGTPIPLTDNEWVKGEITTASNGELWYSFDVAGGAAYRVWWNESGTNGNGLFRTLDVSTTAWYASTGNNIFYNIDNGWSNTQSFTTPAAPTADTVYIKVYPKTAEQTGTFDIMYSSTVATRPAVPFRPEDNEPPNPVPLVAGVWADGEINATTSPSGDWYSFDVSSGTSYYVWWNEAVSNGNGSKTLNVRVTGYYSDGAIITNFSDQDTAWATSRNFTPTSNGTVYLRVLPSSSGTTGTFGIAYKIANTRPLVLPSNVTALTVNQWKDGEITASTPLGELWYSFPVSSGTYNVWWNEPAANGNDSKTLNVKVSGYYSDGTVIFTDQDTAWATARNFTAASTDTVYLKVTPYTSGQTGTFGIVHSTASTRPLVPIIPFNVTQLTAANQWADGSITNQTRELWYSFTTPATSTYNNVLWNEAGTNGGKTMDVKVSAYYADGTIIFSGVDTGPQQFSPTTSTVVYLKVTPSASAAAANGTFGIVYYLGSTVPNVPAPSSLPSNITPLANGQWMDGEITENGGERWYSVSIPASTTYYFWWNDSKQGQGSGGKTLDVRVSGYYIDQGQTTIRTLTNTSFADSGNSADSAWTSPKSFTVGSTSLTAYFMVSAFTPGNTGTFSLVYSNINSRPQEIFAPPNPTTLTAGSWANGNIATAGGYEWFKFTATAATQYIHFSGGTLSQVYVQIFDSNGATVGQGTTGTGSTNMYNSGNTSRPVTLGDTYYVRVWPMNSSGNNSSGTYRIAFNTSTTTPN